MYILFFLKSIYKAQEEAAKKEAEEKAKAERKENGEEEEEVNDMAVLKFTRVYTSLLVACLCRQIPYSLSQELT